MPSCIPVETRIPHPYKAEFKEDYQKQVFKNSFRFNVNETVLSRLYVVERNYYRDH